MGAAAAVTFSFGIIAIAVTRTFEKLADGLLSLSVLGSAPAFFPARCNGHKRVDRDNKWDRELAEYSIYLRSLIVSLSPHTPLLYFSEMWEYPGELARKENKTKLTETINEIFKIIDYQKKYLDYLNQIKIDGYLIEFNTVKEEIS